MRHVAGGTAEHILMNMPLAEALQYRTAFWIMEGREVRAVTHRPAARNLTALAG